MKKTLILGLLILIVSNIIYILNCNPGNDVAYLRMIEAGQYSQAKSTIRDLLVQNNKLSESKIEELKFEFERMDRIEKDFNQSEGTVTAYISKYIPEVTGEDIYDTAFEQERHENSILFAFALFIFLLAILVVVLPYIALVLIY